MFPSARSSLSKSKIFHDRRVGYNLFLDDKTMIRNGKSRGWLSSSIESLRDWATLNQVTFNGIEIGQVRGSENKGSGIKALASRLEVEQNPLLIVPSDLILSRGNVQLYSKSDKHLRDALDAAGEFGKTARGSILIFLLVQATRNCPDVPETIGVSCAFSEYLKYLPLELLPTFWSEDELALLQGTSLAPAIETKMKSLFREFNSFRDSTAHIDWCRKYWWDEVDGVVTFDDWKQVDAMYRSRALEFPGIGDAMVPVVDMANHASGLATVALYESDDCGNGLLLQREGKDLQHGDEITITYGDEKGACEMLFSYGFIEDDMESARDILLNLDIPDDDPLKLAKKAVSTYAPGVRLIDKAGKLRWESDYIWMVCVNEEDGLEFKLLQTTDGGRELVATWHDKDISDGTKLKPFLQESPLWNVYQLRAVSLIQERVEQQLETLMTVDDSADEVEKAQKATRPGPAALSKKLRDMEFALLERFYEHLENEKMALVESDAVQQYLASSRVDMEEDFS